MAIALLTTAFSLVISHVGATIVMVPTAINPVIGLGSFIAQALLRGPAIAAATRSFDVSGTWDNPVVTPVTEAPSPAKKEE